MPAHLRPPLSRPLISRPLISERRIRARVAALARAIDADYRGENLGLVAVLKSAAVFAADLLRRLETPATLDFLAASSYRGAATSSGAVTLGGGDALAVAGRHLIVVEDILDTGLTACAVLDRLRREAPASLALCALLRKPAAAALDLPVAYVGFDIADDFVVGYGMDYAERYRNLRAIHRLARR
ncbi:MAG TPA: hypoxanthine phosphoribosyltransferase [Stellaceae bacterium]|nr:hypoxanthine phosphoribosyltransferase [Stellaceae bacterium]